MKLQKRGSPYSAFTALDLMVVTGLVVLLGVVMIPALAKTKPDVRTLQCLENHRRLILAWRMYSQDNAGTVAANGTAVGPAIARPLPWAAGWLDWSTAKDNTNILLLIDSRYASLAPYVRGAAGIFRCPSDTVVSAAQSAMGWTRRARSCSASIWVGNDDPWWPRPLPPEPVYKQIRKDSELLNPTPGETWVHLDEHPYSINDDAFLSPSSNRWSSVPATYHNRGGSFAFADGHCEIHRWQGSLTLLPQILSQTSPIPAPPGDPDLHWVAYHTARLSSASY